MAVFTASPIASAGSDPDAYWDAQRNSLASLGIQQAQAQQAQLNPIAVQSAQQDLLKQQFANQYTQAVQPAQIGLLTNSLAAISSPNQTPAGGVADPTAAQSAQSPSFQQSLAQTESSGDPTRVNDAGYAGLYQFGTKRLADLGLYQPANGESTATNQWQGQFNIPGFPQVKTLADFRANPAAQNVAFQTHVGNIDQAIAQTPGAQGFDQNGLRAVAHLGGVEGMQKFVASGGKYNPSDSNGTSLSSYYQRFSGQPNQQPAAPVQLASAANSNGMAPTATDATVGSPASASPSARRLPIARADEIFPANGNVSPSTASAPIPTPDSPHDSPSQSNAVPVDNMDAAQGLPAGTMVRLPDGTVQATGVPPAQPPAPVAAAPVQAAASSPPSPSASSVALPPQNPLASLAPSPPQPPVGIQSTPAIASVPQTSGPIPQPPAATGQSPADDARALAAVKQVINLRNAALATPGGQGMRTVGMLQQTLDNIAQTGTIADPGTGQVLRVPGAYAAKFSITQAAEAGKSGPAGALYAQNKAVDTSAEIAKNQAIESEKTRQIGMRPIPVAPNTIVASPNQLGVTNTQSVSPLDAMKQAQQEMAPQLATMDPATANQAVIARAQQIVNGGASPATAPFQAGPKPVNPAEAQQAAYTEDRRSLDGITEAGQQAQSSQLRLLQMRDLINGLQTGTGSATKAQVAATLQSYLPSSFAGQINSALSLPDPVAAQEFTKLAVQNAGLQERGALGARGGIQALRLYQSANPDLEKLPDTNKRVINAQLVAAQADQDYAAGAQGHVNQQGSNYMGGKGYTPLSNFDQAWQQQRNPQVYAGAISLLNGDPYQHWAQGLTPEEQARAKQVATRVDSTATYSGPQGKASLTQSGGAQPIQNGSAAPAVGAVMQGYRFNGGNPSNPASWTQVH